MKISYLVPGWSNLGDKVIWAGIKCHYEKLYPNAEHELFFFSDRPTKLETDLFVLAGTPWIWDLCTRSNKYKLLSYYLNLVKCDRKEALGIGSCYQLYCLKRKWIAFQHLSECDGLNRLWTKFDYISVRDEYAKYILDTIQVPCELQKCPAYNTVDYLNVKPKEGKYNLLVLYDLISGIGSEIMPPSTGERWNKLITDAINRYGINKFIVLKESEIKLASSLGLEVEQFIEKDTKSTDFEKLKSLLECLASANVVISPRIHISIPSICLGKKTLFIPIDSRCLTIKGGIDYYEENKDVERIF